MAESKVPSWFSDNIDDQDLALSTLFKFNITIGSGAKAKTVSVDLLQDIDIDYEYLEDHLSSAPAQYVFWASVYSEMRQKVTLLEIQKGKVRGQVAATTLAEYKKNGIKLTDKQLSSLVDGDAQLIKIDVELAITQKQVGKLYHMVEAVRMKSENCRSLAGFKRQDKEQSSST